MRFVLIDGFDCCCVSVSLGMEVGSGGEVSSVSIDSTSSSITSSDVSISEEVWSWLVLERETRKQDVNNYMEIQSAVLM